MARGNTCRTRALVQDRMLNDWGEGLFGKTVWNSRPAVIRGSLNGGTGLNTLATRAARFVAVESIGRLAWRVITSPDS